MKKVVIALGGNALGNTPEEQKERVKHSARSIVDFVQSGVQVLVCHGNGPQVGMIKKSMDIAAKSGEKLPFVPFPECGAMSEGYIGYHLQNAICNEFRVRKMNDSVATLVTQVQVDACDPSFQRPTKPIGTFMSKEDADKLAAAGVAVAEDAGRGYRQVVASPAPVRIVEEEAVRKLLDQGVTVIAGGGGGVPVVEKDGVLTGVDAVIDKDFTSVKLAETVDADVVVILTAVEKVAIRFGTPDQQWLDKLTVAEAKKYIEDKEFAEGSMLPKIRAAIKFAESKPGRKALITSLEKAKEGLEGSTGTWIQA
ncbi:carbamate kinase [Pyramidobacter piscolens W5455]|uniref:Carbamate kinase n=1 Tax=Pyramidobacter piscolens W5455 TaxID=352165 RepID=A0ABP2HX29_9BACT|nr:MULTISPECIES: carbamate kinase [Pyramidobacter]EFB91691.1 carbamate kinase [Pyramidobacter piscolens W5455]RKJ79021.1 carbamate kinase [Pyramidobacter sp. CG50-2]BDF79685.1 carbamate kinase [Pyramidobacter piscolens]